MKIRYSQGTKIAYHKGRTATQPTKPLHEATHSVASSPNTS